MQNLAEKAEGRERRAHLIERLTDALIRYSDMAKPGPLVVESGSK